MTPDELKTRFRRDVDDIQFDPNDESDLLWTSDDVDYYLDEAHREFVVRTRYLHEKIPLQVVGGIQHINLPERIVEPRDDKAYLVNADRLIPEQNFDEHGPINDDYGIQATRHPVYSNKTGEPQQYSLDIEDGKLMLFPTPVENDTLELLAYVEPKDVSDCREFALKNNRHITMLLDGMKALAYDKQDADAYDPKQSERWRKRFEDNIAKVHAERFRRRRRPGIVKFGGI